MSAKILMRQPEVGVGGGGGNETFKGQKQPLHSGSEHLVEMRVRVIGAALPTPGIVLGSHTRLSSWTGRYKRG